MFLIVKRRGRYIVFVLLLRTTTDGLLGDEDGRLRCRRRSRSNSLAPRTNSTHVRCSMFDSDHRAHFERVRPARGRDGSLAPKTFRQRSGNLQVGEANVFLPRPLATVSLGRPYAFRPRRPPSGAAEFAPCQLTQVSCALRNILSAVRSALVFINGTRSNIRFCRIILSPVINDVSVTLNAVDVASADVRSSCVPA